MGMYDIIANGAVSLLFSDWTADNINSINFMFGVILTAHIHNTDVQWHEAYCKRKSFSRQKKAECYAMAKSINWSEPDSACIVIAEGKTEGIMS